MRKVYAYRIWDEIFGGYVYPMNKATIEGIKIAEGYIIDDTEQMVSCSRIDCNYHYLSCEIFRDE